MRAWEILLDLMPQGLRVPLPSCRTIFERIYTLDNGRSSKPPEEDGEKAIKKSERAKDKNNRKKFRMDWAWTIKVFLSSLSVSAVLTVLSSQVLEELALVIAFIILFLFIFINIFFDVIGLAVTTAEEAMFHSMAARKLKVGNKAVYLIRNAEKVSNFCSDVVGDIAGVVSGSTGTAIVTKMFASSHDGEFVGNIIVTALIAGITVGGKAIGKALGMYFNQQIVTATARFLCFFDRFKRDKNGKK